MAGRPGVLLALLALSELVRGDCDEGIRSVSEKCRRCPRRGLGAVGVLSSHAV